MKSEKKNGVSLGGVTGKLTVSLAMGSIGLVSGARRPPEIQTNEGLMELYFSYKTARTRRLRFVTLAQHTGDGTRVWKDLSMLEYFRDTLKNYRLHTGKTQIRLHRPPVIEGDVLVLHGTDKTEERWNHDGRIS